MSNTAQIEQRLRYLGIDDVVIDDLLSAREILEPKLDQMLDSFYARIMDEPELKDLFPDDQSMARARQAQKTHWLESFQVFSKPSQFPNLQPAQFGLPRRSPSPLGWGQAQRSL